MRRLSAAITLCVLAPCVATMAQEAGQAADVLAAARNAIGGKKLDTIKTFSAEGVLQRNVGSFQMSADLELLIELPDKYVRSETVSGPIGFNGDRPIKPAGAMAVPGGGMVIRMGPGGPMSPDRKLSPEEQEKADRAMVRSQRSDLSRLMLGWFAMAHPSLNAQYSYAGEAESPDGKAHIIDVKAESFAARLFIDQETHLPLMVTYQGPQPRIVTATGPRPANERMEDVAQQTPTLVDHTLFFEDWSESDGVKFPHKIRRAVAGATTEEWSVTKIKVNPKIDPKKFGSES